MGRTESPSQGYRLTAASLPAFCADGRTVRSQEPLILSAAQGVSRPQEGAFFFTKKAYCGNQTISVAESRKSVQT